MIKPRVIFFGTPDFAVPALQVLADSSEVSLTAVVTQPDRPAGRGQKLRASPVKQYAEQLGIPIIQPQSVKRKCGELITTLSSSGDITLGVVAAFGQILPQQLLDFPCQGFVNLHASLLPRWRGAAPIQRALLSGDSVTGICLMQMDAGLDTGPILARTELTISPQETAGSLHDRLALAGAKLLGTRLRSLVNGDLIAVPQPEVGITYADKIAAKDTLIHWQQPATEIDRCIRALAPFPGAYTSLATRRIKVFQAAVHSHSYSLEAYPPGTVSFRDQHTLEIACGAEWLELKELQLEGKQRLPVADFLRGAPWLQIGTKLV